MYFSHGGVPHPAGLEAEENRPSSPEPCSPEHARLHTADYLFLLDGPEPARPGVRQNFADAHSLQPSLQLPRPRMQAERPHWIPPEWIPIIPPGNPQRHPVRFRTLVAAAAGAVLMIVALRPLSRKLDSQAVVQGSLHVLEQGWGQIVQTIHERAAIRLYDDFHGGLQNWHHFRGGAPWSYDAAGFVRPASLALYEPSLALEDYDLEFLTQIEQGSLGVAFRALNENNYYVWKLVADRSGSQSQLDLVRCAVVGGKEVGRFTRRLYTAGPPISVYRVRLSAKGADFTLMVQGRVADYWSDARFKRGGIGFFSGQGEQVRLGWVEIAHQYDSLGRLCALVAPSASNTSILQRVAKTVFPPTTSH